jgi:hypothetical protein
MFRPRISVTPERERVELLILGSGLTAIAAVFGLFLNGRIFPAVLLLLGLLAFAGAIDHRRIGHDVYLAFLLIALAVGRIVSPVIVFAAYVLGVGLFGSLLRLIGMNKMNRDFMKCRAEPTMFVNPSPTRSEGFRRQS